MMGRPKEISDEQILAAARKHFIENGPQASVAQIAKSVGVSHTTIFNRFGTKDELLRASLKPPTSSMWLDHLANDPDDSPLKEQLVAHAVRISRYVSEVQRGVDVLHACGADLGGVCDASSPTYGPALAFDALTGWLRRSQSLGRLGPCDVDTLATALLGVLHTKNATSRVCAAPPLRGTGEDYVRDFVDLLWDGIKP